MQNKPRDPAQNAVEQQQGDVEGMEGQEGYGVEYEDGQFRGDDAGQAPGARSGSFEQGNAGGYGTVPPDPESQQGQGGQ